MSGPCSAHQYYDPNCSLGLCRPPREGERVTTEVLSKLFEATRPRHKQAAGHKYDYYWECIVCGQIVAEPRDYENILHSPNCAWKEAEDYLS